MRIRSLSLTIAAAAASVSLVVGAAPHASAVPSGFTDTAVVPGAFSDPTAVKVLPGGRLLVLEQGGGVKIVQTTGTITDAGQFDVCDGGERGLLSAALDPGFATNGVLYVYMTRDPGGGCRNTLVKVTLTGNTIDVAGEQVLVDNIQWTATNHNGGTVEVGHDGYLYLSVGEGANADRAQDLGSLGGKILRITAGGEPAPGNPFLAAAGHGRCARSGQNAAVCEEIYALGLRNPFRIAFDPNTDTTRFRINDVGQNTWEEIDEGAAGANYGWPACEGPCTPANPAYTDPLTYFETGYVVGGAFIPNGWWGSAYDGGYLFADGATNDMWLLTAAGDVNYADPFADSNLSVATDLTFGVRNGERALFYVNNSNGELRKIVGPNAATSDPAGPAYLGGTGASQPPPITPTPGAHVFTAYPTAERVFDSRNGIGSPVGKVTGGETRTVPLGVPAGATAALVNITLDNATPNPEQQCAPPSYLVAWKPGTAMPATSNANVGSCDVAANVGVLAVDAAGATAIQVYADTHVILDVLGYYTEAGMPVEAGRFVGVTPARLLDTRAPAADGANPYTRTDTGNESVVRLPVAGRVGVPANATTVSLTVTAIGPGSDAGGYVTAYAGGTPRPETSTVNHTGSGDTRANLALVPLGADGTVELYLYQVANVVVDVGGWITSAAEPAATTGRLRLTAPARIADSRNGTGVSPLTPNGQVVLEPVGVPQGTNAIVQNVTMVSHAPGWICATPNPWAGGDVSVQNAREAGQDRPAMTFTTLGAGPEPRLRYCSQDNADIIVDVFGWFE